MRLVLLGPPGAGKGTQARVLGELWGIPQIASGDLLRAVVRENSALGREAASYMDRGQLVPDEFVLKLVAERLQSPTPKKASSSTDFPATSLRPRRWQPDLSARGSNSTKSLR